MHLQAALHITPVRSVRDVAAAVDLFRAYAASPDVDLSHQNFEAELAARPGQYAAPAGALLLGAGPAFRMRPDRVFVDPVLA